MSTIEELEASQQSMANQLASLASELQAMQSAQQQQILYARLAESTPLRFGDFPTGASVDAAGTSEPGQTSTLADNAVTADAIAPGAVEGTAFASSIRPIALVTALPTLPDALYPAGAFVYKTNDSPPRLYKSNGTAWVAGVGPNDIEADSITAGQIAAGAISTTELAAGAVTAAKLAVGGSNGLAITNPGFETGDLTGWEEYKPVATGSVAVEAVATASVKAGTGKYQVLITKSSAGAGPYVLLTDHIPCRPGDNISVSAVLGGQDADIQVYFYDKDKAYISQTGTTLATSITTGTRYSTTVSGFPASTAYVRFAVGNDSSASFPNYTAVDDLRVAVGDANLIAAAGNVVIDSSGITVTNGAITVTNAGATVIIDGTSDMFRISATGTTSTTASMAGNSITVGLSSLGTLSGVPAFMGYLTVGTDTNIHRHLLPISISSTPVLKYAAATSGGATNQTILAGTGVFATLSAYLSGTSSGTLSLSFYLSSTGSTATYYCRYYVLEQAAI